MVSLGLGHNSWRCGFCACWFHCQHCGAVFTCTHATHPVASLGPGQLSLLVQFGKSLGCCSLAGPCIAARGEPGSSQTPFWGHFPERLPLCNLLGTHCLLLWASPFPLSDQKVGPSCWPLCWLLLHLVSVCRGPNSCCWVLLLSDPSATPYLLESPHRCSYFLSGFYCERGWCAPVPSYPELELLNDC